MKHTHVPAGEPLRQPIGVEEFKSEVRVWAQRIGVEPAEIHVRSMRRKWASCSSRGRVTFDADLLLQQHDFRSEVIVHELVHLKVPNHGGLFTALLRAHLGGHTGASTEAGPTKGVQ